MHKPRGRRWQRAARGACLRACAIAGAAGLGGAMRANGAPTRPQAASGGMGAERPMRARGDGGAEALVAPSASAAQRSAAAADRAPPSPALGYGFPAGGEAREGDGGSERSERRGKGERAAIRRARIKARPLGRATAYPIGWAGWGMVPARQVGPRQKTSISSRLASIGDLLGGSHRLDMAPGWPNPHRLRAGRLSSAHRHARNGPELALESRGLILVIKYTKRIKSLDRAHCTVL